MKTGVSFCSSFNTMR